METVSSESCNTHNLHHSIKVFFQKWQIVYNNCIPHYYATKKRHWTNIYIKVALSVTLETRVEIGAGALYLVMAILFRYIFQEI